MASRRRRTLEDGDRRKVGVAGSDADPARSAASEDADRVLPFGRRSPAVAAIEYPNGIAARGDMNPTHLRGRDKGRQFP